MSQAPPKNRKPRRQSRKPADQPVASAAPGAAPDPEPPETMKPIRIGSRLLRGAAR